MRNNYFHFHPTGHRPSDTSVGTDNPRASLPTSPHYSDERYSRGQTHTLYCKRGETLLPGYCDTEHVEGASYVYSDRLEQWDYEKMRRAKEEAKQSWHPVASANYYSAMLSFYKDKKVEVVHVTAGVNVSNGYPYYVLGYREIA